MKRFLSVISSLCCVSCLGAGLVNGTLSPVIGIGSGGSATNATWVEPTVYYVSPTSLGNDTNSGRNRSIPLNTYVQAVNLAYSNAPATIVLMAGTYLFPGTNGSFADNCIVPPFVNLVGEVSNNVVITFTNTTGTLGIPGMQPCGTNQITGVNFTFLSGSSSDVPLGNFGGNNGSFLPLDYSGNNTFPAGVPISINEVKFQDCTFRFAGTGIHFEGSGATTLFNWDFNRCKFLCNNNFIQMREAGPLITVENSDVTLLNWTNVPVINNKPLRMFETRTLPNVFSNNFPVRISNTQFRYSDTDLSNSNRPVFLCWNTQNTTNTLVATNIFEMQNCSLEATSITNSLSVDFPPTAFNTKTQCVVTLKNVFRIDNGGLLTTSSGYSIRTLADSTLIGITATSLVLTNIILNPIVSGGSWTNTNSFTGTLRINGTLTDAVSGDPGLNMTNIISGEFCNTTSSLAVAGIIPFSTLFRMAPNDYVVVTNQSSGSGAAAITSSSFRP